MSIYGIIARLLSSKSPDRRLRLARMLSFVWYYMVPIRRSTVMRNLGLALPEHATQHPRITRDVFANTALNMIEFFSMTVFPSIDPLQFIHLEGESHYREAFGAGKGVIVVTAHLGNFDLLACSQSARQIPLAIISKTLHNNGANSIWMKTRRRFGVAIFSEKECIKQGLRWLRRGNVLGIVADQRTRSEKGGILSPFFAREVWTSTLPSRLAMKTDATLLPVFIARRNDGTHCVTIDPPIALIPADTATESIARTTHFINARIEHHIRQAPENWLWLHRRFEN